MTNDGDPPFERLQFFAQRHRPRRMPTSHWHSQVELNYLSRGQMTYLINGHLVPLPARRLGLFWGATPHQVIAQDDDSDLVAIYVPLGAFLGLKLPSGFRRRVMGGGFLVDRDVDPADGFLFPRWHDELQSDRSDFRDLVRHEIGCRLWRLALSGHRLVRSVDVDARPGPSATGASLERVRQMAMFIAEHCDRHLTVEDIARTAEVHPNHAMTLFRRIVGMTISEYLVRQRLSRAQSLLLDTDLPTAIIAEKSGFGSRSRFYEVFRQWVGTHPRRFRSEVTMTMAGLAGRRPLDPTQVPPEP